MRSQLVVCALACTLLPVLSQTQTFTPRWEDLTSEDFVKAIALAKGTCVLPFGIVEKHGPSGTLGTDMINVRAAALEAATTEYAPVFPPYYFGQIAEARHQPGTLAYRSDLQLLMLQATVDEMARNGCRKILIANGHGGNTALLQYFLQTQLDSDRHSVVYVSGLGGRATTGVPAAALPSKPGVDGHAGEGEVSGVMANAPGTAHPERAGKESGADQKRLVMPEGMTTAISWYSSYPNHYQGDAAGATADRGNAMRAVRAQALAEAIRFVKNDTSAPRLQDEFFSKTANPLATKQ